MTDARQLHTFVVCAYKESPYIGQCIESLQSQTVKSQILMVTSTPSDYLKGISEKYGIPLYVNDSAIGQSNIATDWNYAIAQAKTKYVTIAHQDDLYKPRYTEVSLRESIRQEKKGSPAIISFTNYSELRGDTEVKANRMLRTKRMLLWPLYPQIHYRSKFWRRRSLSFGDAICCPSVMFNRDNTPKVIFKKGFRSCLDWEAWEMLSRRKGSFVYCREILMSHRIHGDSATTAIIADGDRTKEDYEIFCRFWPKWFAGILEGFYRAGEKSNKL